MELNAIAHQMTDSDGLVTVESERVVVAYAMAVMSSMMPVCAYA